MVDGVVLAPFDEPEQVRELQRDQPVVGHQLAQASGEVDDVGHVREHVVRHHQVGPTVRTGDLPPALLPRKRTTVRTPRRSAAAATFAAGSTPSTGTPRGNRCWSR